ncbi:ABC transporter permease subunit [Luethyella okanaganae]|uniref:ABC transporter permease subunit n=1 Tax=Luethyella okanaganae TaxID=69372 RepID=A0ABW1VHZ0_9MICO
MSQTRLMRGGEAVIASPPRSRSHGRLTPRLRDALVTSASRVATLCGVVFLIGLLPWLSGRSPEITVLRARYAELEPTPEVLASIRAQLGLDRGPLGLFGDWLGGVLTGDWGTSWISGRPVLPGVLGALGVSLTLMAFALGVSLIIATLLCLPALRRGLLAGGGSGSGATAATLTALPEFLLAASLLVVGSVWLGWFPPYGWQGLDSAVLPALALGIPAGGLIGRLTADAIAAAFAESWIVTWHVAGFSSFDIAGAVLRRALPSVLPQIGLVVVGLTGGAIAVEQVFSIPGLGRTTLGAAESQDLPTLQAGVLALLVIAATAGILASIARRAMLGPALRAGIVPVPVPARRARRGDAVVPVVAATLLVVVIALGLLRDPFASAHGRLAAPSLALPMGADASGRDLLARVGHGALQTLGPALLVALICFVLGLLIGLLPRASAGLVEVTNAAPPVLAGILVAAASGPSVAGAVTAVALVSWAPLAAHTAALAVEARAQPHIKILGVLGVGRGRTLWRSVVPAVAPPVFRHAMLRFPAIALALAALGFLGLGSQPPSPEWGMLLAEGMPYVERAPWAVLAPMTALVLGSVLAVSLSSLPAARLGRADGTGGSNGAGDA